MILERLGAAFPSARRGLLRAGMVTVTRTTLDQSKLGIVNLDCTIQACSDRLRSFSVLLPLHVGPLANPVAPGGGAWIESP